MAQRHLPTCYRRRNSEETRAKHCAMRTVLMIARARSSGAASETPLQLADRMGREGRSRLSHAPPGRFPNQADRGKASTL